jgi:hypothetical protein
MSTKKLRLILAGLTLSFGAVHSYADDAKSRCSADRWRHDAFAKRDVRQADLAGGERRGCVQINILSGDRMPKAKLRHEVA